MKTIIIGAGVTGLSCAYHLKKDYLLFEKENIPGGLCRSITTDGFTFDYTGHAIHVRSDYAKKLVLKLISGNVNEVKRNARIYSNSLYVKYPFQANLFGLPEKVIKDCLVGLIEVYLKSSGTQINPLMSFHDWVLMTFGPGLAKHFFFPYNGKLLNTPLKNVTADWVGSFVPRPKLEETILGAVTDFKKDFGYNVFFYYPVTGGIQFLVDKIGEKVNGLCTGSEINL